MKSCYTNEKCEKCYWFYHSACSEWIIPKQIILTQTIGVDEVITSEATEE